MDSATEQEGLRWQVGVWDRISQLYRREVEPRFAAVVENVVRRGDLKPGDRVLDLGTGTGAVAMAAANLVGPAGQVTGVDISPDMLALAKRRVVESGHSHVDLREGRAEQLPAGDGSFEVVLASLSLMYVIDRAAAAREIRRVLRPGGRFVAAVWADPEQCDIVLFQQTAGRFAPTPPVPGVGPGGAGRPDRLPGAAGRRGDGRPRRDGGAGLRLRRLRIGVGGAGGCDHRRAPSGAATRGEGGRPGGHVAAWPWPEALSQRDPVSRRTCDVTGADGRAAEPCHSLGISDRPHTPSS